MTQIHELVHDLLAVKAREKLQRDLREAQDEDDQDKIDQLKNLLFEPVIDPTPDDNTMVYYRDNGSRIQSKAIRTPIEQEKKRLATFEAAAATIHWNPMEAVEAVIESLYQEALAMVHGMDPRKWTRDPCLDAGVRDLIQTVLICKEAPDGSLRDEQEHNDWKVFLWLEYQDIRQWDYAHVELPPSEEDLLRPETPEPYDGIPALYSLDTVRQRDCPKCFGNGHGRDHALWTPDKTRSTPRFKQLGEPATAPCLSCDGKGKRGYGKCWICQGTGKAESQCEYCAGTGFDPMRSFRDPNRQREGLEIQFKDGHQVPKGKVLCNLPSGPVVVTRPTGDVHTCPACGSPMWDNTAKNKERIKEGKRMMPQHACCACSTVIWANGGLTYNLSPRSQWMATK